MCQSTTLSRRHSRKLHTGVQNQNTLDVHVLGFCGQGRHRYEKLKLVFITRLTFSDLLAELWHVQRVRISEFCTQCQRHHYYINRKKNCWQHRTTNTGGTICLPTFSSFWIYSTISEQLELFSGQWNFHLQTSFVVFMVKSLHGRMYCAFTIRKLFYFLVSVSFCFHFYNGNGHITLMYSVKCWWWEFILELIKSNHIHVGILGQVYYIVW